jgi:DNA-binding CsgD family transcriptional regulator
MGAAALVLEPDPLVRLLIGPAVAALGFGVVTFGLPGTAADGASGLAPDPVAVFLPLARVADCRLARGDALTRGGAPLVVGYGEGPAPLLSAHRAHRCCDLVLHLSAAGGGPRLCHLPAGDAVSTAGLSAREADVLVLLLGGLTTAGIAARLGVAECTARSHCRAVLRKMGAPDRGALRAALLAPEAQDGRIRGQCPRSDPAHAGVAT